MNSKAWPLFIKLKTQEFGFNASQNFACDVRRPPTLPDTRVKSSLLGLLPVKGLFTSSFLPMGLLKGMGFCGSFFELRFVVTKGRRFLLLSFLVYSPRNLGLFKGRRRTRLQVYHIQGLLLQLQVASAHIQIRPILDFSPSIQCSWGIAACGIGTGRAMSWRL